MLRLMITNIEEAEMSNGGYIPDVTLFRQQKAGN